MEHIAIDLGGRESQVCVRLPDGTVILERKVKTERLESFLKKRAASRVILETCAEAFGVADKAIEHGHEVLVVPALLVRQLGVGARGVKTDERDARCLSEASCRIDLPSVHICSARSRARPSPRSSVPPGPRVGDAGTCAAGGAGACGGGGSGAGSCC